MNWSLVFTLACWPAALCTTHRYRIPSHALTLPMTSFWAQKRLWMRGKRRSAWRGRWGQEATGRTTTSGQRTTAMEKCIFYFCNASIVRKCAIVTQALDKKAAQDRRDDKLKSINPIQTFTASCIHRGKKKYCNISSHFEWKSFIKTKSKTQFAHWYTIISTRKKTYLFTLVLTVWMRATTTYKKGWETKQPSARNGIVISRTSWSLWKVEITLYIKKVSFLHSVWKFLR